MTELSCGAKALIFEFLKPVKKQHVPFFTAVGYIAPAHFLNAGIFYIQKPGIVASGGFGALILNVRCSAKNCDELLKEFEDLLDKVTA